MIETDDCLVPQILGPSLRETCQRLGLVISQRYQTTDIMQCCELVGLPFKATQSVLIENDMLVD